jgi:hypothetical protein
MMGGIGHPSQSAKASGARMDQSVLARVDPKAMEDPMSFEAERSNPAEQALVHALDAILAAISELDLTQAQKETLSARATEILREKLQVE